ncbi:CGG triplet repeat-binding protein 1 [Acipenser ruthenus]|uniref:CGG triplet repeat-binding protein 1 n=1 Tax=Acipenser ruthenus TaxID=7906 RepID=A0A444UEM3_ACIRT|nr:CGG triplet repeat-binding protein 1 [Acipenser ruthenus]
MAARCASASHISAKQHEKDFPSGEFHSSDDVLFCSVCNEAVDHNRKDTCVKHLKSDKHLKRKLLQLVQSDSGETGKKQVTVSSLFTAQTKAGEVRDLARFQLTEALIKADIPLEKVDNASFKIFLEQNMKTMGVVPSADWLRKQ